MWPTIQAHGLELWISDGTEAGTMLLKETGTVAEPTNLRRSGNYVYFNTSDGNGHFQLWRKQ